MNRRLLFATVAVVLAACGAIDDADTTVESTSSTSPATETTVDPDRTTTTEAAVPNDSDVSDAARADLAERLQTEPGAIAVVQVRDVQWPDGSLGCPQDGELYTQAIVDGQQILLEVDERVFDYRADDVGNVTLCPSEDKDGGYDFVPPPGIDN